MQESRTQTYRGYELVVEISGEIRTGPYVLRQPIRQTVEGVVTHVPRVNMLFSTREEAFAKTLSALHLLVDAKVRQHTDVIDFSRNAQQ
ncbi:hypothetical protein EVC45_38425 [Paraburkholderia sp. UYCP14C]|uniref:hypothetical protein n=1 Tax=Paraburkholderia sp. UYCP14C TaxID=2511130 RepID=UPI0010204738|nr:hypothetical protein [Paraburkholderia sp. UYCP14C]RZF24490.1 hypothetical protein EVC45_38425 [Paraburkholderia sp. UYCP14C]